MRYLLIIIFGLLLVVVSCSQRHPGKKAEGKKAIVFESFYKKLQDTIEFRRFSVNMFEVEVQHGRVFPGYFGLAYQMFTDRYNLVNKGKIVDSLAIRFKKNGFVQKIAEGRDVMFVQLISDSLSNFEVLNLLSLRHKIEDRIDNKLKEEKSGEWFAGDMGAGANMLFYVDNWDRAIQIVNKILIEENMLGDVLIAKRVMISQEDWMYEIVYPEDYQGVFNSM